MGNAAAYAGTPDAVGAFGKAVGHDAMEHPFNYILHAAGLALPFMGVGEAVEGIATGVEALKTAFDLQKEAGQ